MIIANDDMNDWIGPLGGLGDLPKTPNVDRLARQSVTFTNVHCASPACSPSMEMMEQDPVGYDIVNSKQVSSAYLPLSKIVLIPVKEK